MKIWGHIKRACTITLRFNSDMADYEAISRYVTKEIVYEKFSRNFNYQTERSGTRIRSATRPSTSA
jgi:hypothetical protein